MKNCLAVMSLWMFWILSPAAALAAAGWESDYAAAQAQARARKLDLLVDFSDASRPLSRKLESEALATPAFAKEAAAAFVLVRVERPSAADPESRRQAAEALFRRFGIQVCPTVLLQDGASGETYAVTGYLEGGAEAYWRHVDGLRRSRLEAVEGLKKAASLPAETRARRLDSILSGLSDQGRSCYRQAMEEIVALDPKNALGLHDKYAFHLEVVPEVDRFYREMEASLAPYRAKMESLVAEAKAAGRPVDAAMAERVALGWRQAVAAKAQELKLKLDQAQKRYALAGEEKQLLMTMYGDAYAGLGDSAKAADAYRQAYESAPGSARAAFVKAKWLKAAAEQGKKE